MMELLAAVAAGLTAGAIAYGLVMFMMHRRKKNAARSEKAQKWLNNVRAALTRSIFGVLGVGLVWTVYFLILGLANPAQAEYAANCATLIVSVLTVFSIIIAFWEFMARGKK